MIISVILVLVAAVIGALGMLFFKKAMRRFSLRALLRNRYFYTGFLMAGMTMILVIIAYRHGEVSVLYPLYSTTYVWTLVFAVKYLKEPMNRSKWVGIMLIVLGALLLGLS